MAKGMVFCMEHPKRDHKPGNGGGGGGKRGVVEAVVCSLT